MLATPSRTASESLGQRAHLVATPFRRTSTPRRRLQAAVGRAAPPPVPSAQHAHRGAASRGPPATAPPAPALQACQNPSRAEQRGPQRDALGHLLSLLPPDVPVASCPRAPTEEAGEERVGVGEGRGGSQGGHAGWPVPAHGCKEAPAWQRRGQWEEAKRAQSPRACPRPWLARPVVAVGDEARKAVGRARGGDDRQLALPRAPLRRA